MRQSRLSDAAIAVHSVLSKADLKFGIFGGYALSILGNPRETAGVDCLVAVDKQQIVDVMDGKEGFVVIPQTRLDYVAFLWTERPDKREAVLVQIFCEKFPDSRYSMDDVQPTIIGINGDHFGNGVSAFLDPVYIFKGKLSAAATRMSSHDADDLFWLEGTFPGQLAAKADEMSIILVGLAIKRHPLLPPTLHRLGIDVFKAMESVKTYHPVLSLGPAPGVVQKGLLAGANVGRLNILE